MKVKDVSIPIDVIIAFLKTLNDEAREEIFEKVFLEEDIEPLTFEERQAMNIAEKELEDRETIVWPFIK